MLGIFTVYCCQMFCKNSFIVSSLVLLELLYVLKIVLTDILVFLASFIIDQFFQPLLSLAFSWKDLVSIQIHFGCVNNSAFLILICSYIKDLDQQQGDYPCAWFCVFFTFLLIVLHASLSNATS